MQQQQYIIIIIIILPDLYSAFLCKYTFKSVVHRTLKNEFTHKIHTQIVNTNHIVTLKI